MGARKNHQPRRGSLAYSPRGRAKSMEARIRAWPDKTDSDKPQILAHCGFKAGCVQVVSIDDREKTPNAGKQLVSLGTVIVTPPAVILGIRGYSTGHNGLHAEFDVFAEDIPKIIDKNMKKRHTGSTTESATKMLKKIHKIFAILAVSPSTAGREQKKPYIFEALVSGGSIPEQFSYLHELLGKEIKINQVFETGASVDVAAITKGKGWQGVIQRFGAKKKQHKSRKTVRELGSLGPISPQSVMYTVPRAGQMGFHQRTEYDKRIMIISNTEEDESIKINPDGGYKHFGLVQGDFIILKGSVPGTYRRLIKLRRQIRNEPEKINKPRILEVVV